MPLSHREALKTVYTDAKGRPRRSWVYKVNRMSDQQVAAVYLRLRNQGKL